MKQIWNTFCEDISKNKGVKEMAFEKEIVKGFLQALGWSRYDRNLEEQYGLYSRKWIPDFVLYLDNDKSAKEIILELKKPDHKQRKVDIEQIEAYMKLTDCRFGLYFGEKLEVFYLEDKDGKRSAASVTTIDWTINNEAGANFIELLKFSNYDRKRLEQFCTDHLYLNSFLRHCNHQGGLQQLYDCIMEHFSLPQSMADSLKTRLKFVIESNPEAEAQPVSSTPIKVTPQATNRKGNVWLICYDSKFFKVEDCFKKYGQIYWTHKAGVLNVQKGDTAYLYAARPESALRFKVEVVESQLPYSPAMDVEDEFSVSGNSNSEGSNRTYFLVRSIAETHSPALKHEALMSMGLMGKRPSTTKLSKEKFKALREYIEQHFEDVAPTEVSVQPSPQKTVTPKKHKKQKTDRRPPFKFSMIGLKPGDTVTFAPNGESVRVNSENTIEYDHRIFTLSGYCKVYMPDNDSENKEYQGPAHFILNGKTLDEIRKEKEK